MMRVAGIGMACPLGLRARPAIAAINAGLVNFVDRDDVPTVDGSATVSMLERDELPLSSRTQRAGFFAGLAVEEALANSSGTQPVPLVLALPRADVGPRIDGNAMMRSLTAVASARPYLHHVIEAGRAGVFEAFEVARALLDQGQASMVAVAGVDSLVDCETLRSLVDRNRLTSSTNVDGIIPGEGAGCVLLGHASSVPAAQTLALLSASAVGLEPIPFDLATTVVSSAQGLTGVFRQLSQAVDGRVDEVIEGTSGEIYFSREFSYAYLRNSGLMPEPLRRRCLSSALGDLGAAAGAISLVHAIVRVGPAAPGNRQPYRRCLAYGSSDSGLVGGAIVVCADGSVTRW